MAVTSSLSIMAGRDRMSAVLEPLLGFELARERANNIAQMLVLGPNDATYIASGMLKGTGLKDPNAVAEAIVGAWREGLQAMERSSEWAL